MALFRKLFSIELNHSYFNSGVASGVNIRPDRETESVIRNNRLIFRSENGKIFVAAQVNESQESSDENDGGGDEKEYRLLRNLDPNTLLRFLIEIENPSFLTISNLPANLISETVMVFSNRNGSVSDEIKYLHPNDESSTDLTIRLQKNRVFRSTEDTEKESARASVQTPDGNQRKDLTSASNDGGTVDFQFDFGNLPPGKYEYWYEEKRKERFYWNGLQRSSGLLGIVEIETSPHVPETHKLISNEGILQHPEFHIQFENRETIWRYHIVSRTDVTLEDCSVVSDEYPFSPKEEPGPGEASKIFESEQPVPLLEKGIKGIRLTIEEDESERLLIDNLPGADIKFIEPDSGDMNRFYSDIYVYI